MYNHIYLFPSFLLYSIILLFAQSMNEIPLDLYCWVHWNAARRANWTTRLLNKTVSRYWRGGCERFVIVVFSVLFMATQLSCWKDGPFLYMVLLICRFCVLQYVQRLIVYGMELFCDGLGLSLLCWQLFCSI
jgi:hypothetical protein